MSATEHPGLGVMQLMAEEAFAALPQSFTEHLADVIVRVEEMADEEMLQSVGLSDPMELSGLYVGQPLGDKSVWESGALPDRIYLFRRPILAEAVERGLRIERLVHHVLVHEIGHHFGFSDEDMHVIEDGA